MTFCSFNSAKSEQKIIFTTNRQVIDIPDMQEKEIFLVQTDFHPRDPEGRLEEIRDCRIILVEHGSAVCEVDFSRYELRNGGLLLIPPESFFKDISMSSDFRISTIVMDFRLWLDITAQFDHAFFAFFKKYPYIPDSLIPEPNRLEIHHMLCAAQRIYNDRRHSFRTKIFGNITQNILFEIHEKIKTELIRNSRCTSARQEKLFEEFIHLVHTCSSERRDVDFYAGKLCITPRYLSDIVGGITGKSPKDLINMRCIQEIKRLLSTSPMGIQEIAFRLHFPDQSCLARYFRKYAGVSPSEYRKSIRR